jgi:chromate transporter
VLALCQFLPGPNVANCSIVLGRRWFGLSGAAAAFSGLMALPFVWVLALAALYTGYGDDPLLRAVISGVGIAGAGLFIGTALKLARPIARRPVALAIVAGCFLAVGLARVPLLVVLPAALAVALLAARKRWI